MAAESHLPDAVEMRVTEARKAHARGWALTPLRGKVPTRKGWQRAPNPDLDTVDQWARHGNIGLRTGKISGVVVIDDDTPDATGTIALNLPVTPIVITGSGKRHHYFRCPEGGLKNSVKKLAGVDVRADGGQVVYVGSIHPDTGKPYVWAPGLSPDDVPLAEVPPHVLAVLATPSTQVQSKTTAGPFTSSEQQRLRRYARAALQNAVARVASTPEGSRNHQLNSEAFSLGRFVAAGFLPREETVEALTSAAERAGLSVDETRRTIESGLCAGTEAPHDAGDMLSKLQSIPRASRPNQPLVAIEIEGGQLPAIVDQAEDALLHDGGEELFQYGNQIVRLVRTTDPMVAAGVLRPTGAIAIRAVDATYLVERLMLAAEFVRQRRERTVAIDCPEKVAKTYLAREGRWRLRKLSGAIEAPTLRPDGSVLDQPGYDEPTGLYFHAGWSTFPPMPAMPSMEDARNALAKLKFVVKDFPFVAASDRSALLSAILTATIRRSIRTAPLFTFSAPKPGSGKSLLADFVAMAATGRPCAVMSQGKDEDEQRKRMLAILLDGESVASIDNIERPLGGASLCMVLTQTRFRDRLLGASKTATASTAITWLATGNNLQISGDLTSRVVPCDLDPQCEDPEQRNFDLNLHEYVPEHRGELVVAALTILRAFHVAGRPRQALTVFGRFEDWSDWIRSALVWLGEADPCAGRVRLQQFDPVREMLANLLARWHDLLGEVHVTVAEAIHRASEPRGATSSDSSLLDALVTVAPGKGTERVDSKQLGHWLRRFSNRIEAELRIERVGSRKSTSLWRVVRVGGPRTSGVGSAGLVGSSGSLASDLSDDQRVKPYDEPQNNSSDPPAVIPPNPSIPPTGRPGPEDVASDDDRVTL